MLLTTSVPCCARCFCSSVPTKWRWERCLRKPKENCHRSLLKKPPSFELEFSLPAHCTPITGALCRAATQPWAQACWLGNSPPKKIRAPSSIIRLNECLNFSILFLLSERQLRAKLDLTAGCSGFRDSSKLWRVHEPIRRAKIDMIQSVESFCPQLKLNLLGDGKLTL